MVYKRTARRMGRRKRYGMRKGTFARKVKKIVNSQSETKYIDISIGGTASSSSFYGVDFITNGNFPIGSGHNQRIGDKIRVLSLRYILQVQPGDAFNTLRTMIVSRPRAALITSGPPAIPVLLGQANTDTFDIHRDFLTYLHFMPVNGSTSDAAGQYKQYRGKIRINRMVEFDGGDALPMRGPTIGLQFHSDSSVVPHPGVYGSVRVYYKDL